jgi:hypothetical protein
MFIIDTILKPMPTAANLMAYALPFKIRLDSSYNRCAGY